MTPACAATVEYRRQILISAVHLREAADDATGSTKPGEQANGGGAAAQRLQLALQAAGVGAWDWNIAQGTVTWSPTLERLHGLAPGSFGGRLEDFERDVHPEDREYMAESLRRTLAEKRRDYYVQYRIVRPDGEIRWLEARGRLQLDAAGEPAAITGICTDVTERRRLEELTRFLAEASGLLSSSLDAEAILERLAELCVPRLADWCVVEVAEGEEVRGLAVAHRDPEKVARAREVVTRQPLRRDDRYGSGRVLRTGEAEAHPEIGEEALVAVAQDEEHLAQLRALGLRSALIVPLKARDQTLGVLTLVVAESGRRYGNSDLELVEELASRAALAVDNARLYAESRAALRSRDEILAVVSHDLRNPLNAIYLQAELLAQAELPPEHRRRHVEAIQRSTERATRLIDDLLTIAQVQGGHLQLQFAAESPAALASEVVEAFREQAQARSIELLAELPPELPRVAADRQRIFQTLSNLLSNALKFTPAGGRVTVGVRAQAGEVVFSVADSGPGIPAAELQELFAPFWRSPSAAASGAGLGLTIASGLVEAHGGRIWVDSSVGEGTTFSFALPSLDDE